MKPITFGLRRIKINRKVLIWGIVLILILIGISSFTYFYRLGKIDLALLMARLALKTEEKEEVPLAEIEEELPIEEEKEIGATPKTYEEEAQAGEGIAHLARKILKKYLEEKEINFNLTKEHKIYIEDYIQNKTGDRWLKLNEKITVSEDLIVEGINQAQKLTPEQLENLKQFSTLVSTL